MTAQRVTPQVRVLGVDDFSFRRGTRYGTILIDHERHCVVDLLPSREAKDLADWLRAHPEVAVITRDRAGRLYRGGHAGSATSPTARGSLASAAQSN
ncbi:MAG: transposase [Blastocatellia bacterium]